MSEGVSGNRWTPCSTVPSPPRCGGLPRRSAIGEAHTRPCRNSTRSCKLGRWPVTLGTRRGTVSILSRHGQVVNIPTPPTSASSVAGTVARDASSVGRSPSPDPGSRRSAAGQDKRSPGSGPVLGLVRLALGGALCPGRHAGPDPAPRVTHAALSPEPPLGRAHGRKPPADGADRPSWMLRCG